MKNRSLSFPGKIWGFGLLLALLPLSVRAWEVRSLLRSAAIFVREGKSASSARILQERSARAIKSPYASSLVALNSDKVLLALPAGREKSETLIVASKRECLGDSSQRILFEAKVQTQVASQYSADSQVIPLSDSIEDVRSTSIHFQLTDSLIFMQASLNGSQPLWMILDTGSSVTVFDESVSKTLGLRFNGEGNVYGPGQGSAQKLAFASHAALRLADAELDDQTVATMPLDWFSRELGRTTDGFLGSNIIRNYVVEIDYANQVLRLLDPATYSYSGPGQRLPLQFIWDNIPSVRAEVVAQDGTAITGIFLIDSGATTAIWLTKAFSEAHPEFLSIPETTEVRNVVAVGGELSTRLGRVPAVRLGGFVVANPSAQFSQNSSGIFATPGLAGTIGAQILRRFKVVLDYPHMEMILEPNEHFDDASE
jgi:aspartyl protease